ncbi:hypothetical protein LWC34_00715 [Kibdelosporangium philippinense]|uniref:Transcriptional regulator, AbiEi antitoxin, Type IV TA system n=1 Tax=Kibdelosporangium philippinense TaxID=211113 RepID=A0ABS8Z461_9PSEU|nr:hypothetical protein [Kibdelosporangium philippinense]MCE7001368.1 hypothetical protein [Kibdelosporangium philippinense]
MPSTPRWSVPDHQQSDWNRLVGDQQGIVSHEQLRRYFGLSHAGIAANVAARRWQRILRGVYATFTGELPRAARLSAAILYGGPDATLSHYTAAEEWGMVPIRDGPVEITVPYGCSAISQPDLVVVHRSRALRFTVRVYDLPRTRRVDTIIDLAVAQPTSQEAVDTMIDLVGRSGVTATELSTVLELRRAYRYRKALDRAVELIAGGLMSVLEAEYLREVELAHGIPPADRQVPFSVDDRVLWEDATYDSLGVPLTVRLDGRAYHATPGVAFRDRRRDNAAELAGRSRLIYGWHEVHKDPCGVASEVLAILRRAGWTGGTSCSRCSRLVSGYAG